MSDTVSVNSSQSGGGDSAHAGIVVEEGTTRGAVDGDVQKALSSTVGTVSKAFSYITDDFYDSMNT